MDRYYKSDEEFVEEMNEKGKVKEVLERIGKVIEEIDPDVIGIEEGPSSKKRMEMFVDRYLHGSFICFGGRDGGAQRIYTLVKKDCSFMINVKEREDAYQYFSLPWAFDQEGNLQIAPYHFQRIPLLLHATLLLPNLTTKDIFFITIHTKSKVIRRGRSLWNNNTDNTNNNTTSTDPSSSSSSHRRSSSSSARINNYNNNNNNNDFIRKAVKNRRKIAGECLRIRKYMDKEIFNVYKDPFIVAMGDLNDGPGRDFFEEYYLLFDSVDALLGSPFSGKKILQPLLIRERFLSLHDQWTYSCFDYVDNVSRNVILSPPPSFPSSPSYLTYFY